MRNDTQDNLNGLSRIVNQLAAERNKTIVGLCLLVIMGFMWVKVLTGKKNPASAQADFAPEQAAMAVQSGPSTRLVFVEPPYIKGRNDVLIRDFFSVKRWEVVRRNEGGGDLDGEKISMTVDSSGGHLNRESILQVAKLLRLSVIELGERPNAFINDTLLSIGENLLLAHEGTMYEFTVVAISGNEVLLTCQGVNIEMKLLQQERMSN